MSLTESLARTVLEFDDVPFRGIVEQSLAGVYVVLDERFMYANDTFAAMFGYSREEFIGRRMVDCVTPDSANEVMENYRRRISGEVQAIHYFTKGVRKDGKIVHLELHASRVQCRGQPALAGVALDVTERVLAQEELRRSREQLRELTRHINKTREAERARLAREVHDVLGGMLTAVKFGLARIVRRTRSGGQPELHEIAGDLLVQMQDTIDTARSISEEMRPATLDHFGLGSALSNALERFGARYGVQVEVVGTEASHRVPPTVAVQIFRIVQEALTNVARHAAASKVELEMSQTEDRFALRLRDNGCGLHATPRRADSIGLFSMAERAREIGATFDVHEHREGGTQLSLVLPLPAAATSTNP
jgi:PAS domain S-box-containing protein